MRAEVLLANRAQDFKILAGQHEDSELHDRVHADPMGREASANVLERDFGLLREAAGNRAVRTHADLACEKKDLVARGNQGRVRVRTHGRMNLAGV